MQWRTPPRRPPCRMFSAASETRSSHSVSLPLSLPLSSESWRKTNSAAPHLAPRASYCCRRHPPALSAEQPQSALPSYRSSLRPSLPCSPSLSSSSSFSCSPCVSSSAALPGRERGRKETVKRVAVSGPSEVNRRDQVSPVWGRLARRERGRLWAGGRRAVKGDRNEKGVFCRRDFSAIGVSTAWHRGLSVSSGTNVPAACSDKNFDRENEVAFSVEKENAGPRNKRETRELLDPREEMRRRVSGERQREGPAGSRKLTKKFCPESASFSVHSPSHARVSSVKSPGEKNSSVSPAFLLPTSESAGSGEQTRKQSERSREKTRRRRTEAASADREPGSQRRGGGSDKKWKVSSPCVRSSSSRWFGGRRKGVSAVSVRGNWEAKLSLSVASRLAKEKKNKTELGMGGLLAAPVPLAPLRESPGLSYDSDDSSRKKRKSKETPSERQGKPPPSLLPNPGLDSKKPISPRLSSSSSSSSSSPSSSSSSSSSSSPCTSSIVPGFLTALKRRQPPPQQRCKRSTAWRVSSVCVRGGDDRGVGTRAKSTCRTSDFVCESGKDGLLPGGQKDLKEEGCGVTQLRAQEGLSGTERDGPLGEMRGGKRKREDKRAEVQLARSGEGLKTEEERERLREQARQENLAIWQRGQDLLEESAFSSRSSPEWYTAPWRRAALSKHRADREKTEGRSMFGTTGVKREEKDLERNAPKREENDGKRETVNTEESAGETAGTTTDCIAKRRPLRRCRVPPLFSYASLSSPSSSSSSCSSTSSSSSSSSTSSATSSPSSSSSSSSADGRRRSARLREGSADIVGVNASVDAGPANSCQVVASARRASVSRSCATGASRDLPPRACASAEVSSFSLNSSSNFRHCAPYVRSLARRAGWERVPPSLLLLFVEELGASLSRGLWRRKRRREGDRQSPRGDREDGSGAKHPEKRRLGEVERLLQVQNEWERAKAVSMWRRARSQGASEGESLKEIRSRLRGHAHPVGCLAPVYEEF
uniref:Uncharacterized protein n=1 Tax=Toxoplasma gondii TgCATBr9 TaxID=943120 RepID=A0A2T6IVZ1_TOXGO|nr:hypothetical protein TGBR9_202520 [Toxoplasma gondii TgCATBr9]